MFSSSSRTKLGERIRSTESGHGLRGGRRQPGSRCAIASSAVRLAGRAAGSIRGSAADVLDASVGLGLIRVSGGVGQWKTLCFFEKPATSAKSGSTAPVLESALRCKAAFRRRRRPLALTRRSSLNIARRRLGKCARPVRSCVCPPALEARPFPRRARQPSSPGRLPAREARRRAAPSAHLHRLFPGPVSRNYRTPVDLDVFPIERSRKGHAG